MSLGREEIPPPRTKNLRVVFLAPPPGGSTGRGRSGIGLFVGRAGIKTQRADCCIQTPAGALCLVAHTFPSVRLIERAGAAVGHHRRARRAAISPCRDSNRNAATILSCSGRSRPPPGDSLPGGARAGPAYCAERGKSASRIVWAR